MLRVSCVPMGIHCISRAWGLLLSVQKLRGEYDLGRLRRDCQGPSDKHRPQVLLLLLLMGPPPHFLWVLRALGTVTVANQRSVSVDRFINFHPQTSVLPHSTSSPHGSPDPCLPSRRPSGYRTLGRRMADKRLIVAGGRRVQYLISRTTQHLAGTLCIRPTVAS